MWKIAQRTFSTTENANVKLAQWKAISAALAASMAISRKMISPAYMLPYSRSECDSGLDTYSMILNNTLKAMRIGDAHNGLMPIGVLTNSLIQPKRPLFLML